jgi:hypothetical protein
MGELERILGASSVKGGVVIGLPTGVPRKTAYEGMRSTYRRFEMCRGENVLRVATSV